MVRQANPFGPGLDSFFGTRTRGRGRAGSSARIMQLGLLLYQQIAMLENKPPVTMALVALQVLLHLRPDGFEGLPSIASACLQPHAMLFNGEWSRLLWAPLLHADEAHLFYNMSSFIWKGAQLEPVLGTRAFLLLVAELALTSSLAYVALAAGAALLSPALGLGLMGSCAVGFSGVLFGLKVVLSAEAAGWSSVAGITLPSKYVCWAELFLVQFMMPRASFVGHLAGILAGLAHVYLVRPCLLAGPGGTRAWWRATPRTHGSGRLTRGRVLAAATLYAVLAAAWATLPTLASLSPIAGIQGRLSQIADPIPLAASLLGGATGIRAFHLGLARLVNLRGTWYAGAFGGWVALPAALGAPLGVVLGALRMLWGTLRVAVPWAGSRALRAGGAGVLASDPGSLIHLLVNLASLVVLGAHIEARAGSAALLGTFLGAGTLGLLWSARKVPHARLPRGQRGADLGLAGLAALGLGLEARELWAGHGRPGPRGPASLQGLDPMLAAGMGLTARAAGSGLLSLFLTDTARAGARCAAEAWLLALPLREPPPQRAGIPQKRGARGRWAALRPSGLLRFAVWVAKYLLSLAVSLALAPAYAAARPLLVAVRLLQFARRNAPAVAVTLVALALAAADSTLRLVADTGFAARLPWLGAARLAIVAAATLGLAAWTALRVVAYRAPARL
ncbi:hypothetical protein APUTEX25_000365 [Auxenochlorella protothecoides]|uniref:Peptidase S54 rhomboid domain-containing protein n=1 Tax=Auxenochlorella protothecoides TaxID=3075 RepID=A0A3M7KWD9_AUXPR|nr:hypothetical protein APUTEX25_000365 [Auxenochlorella protothecoides]|eukprot:RMZ54848.1 hypothetical protein APUTEX25_000365 [Auxenochlorella protothecoides]